MYSFYDSNEPPRFILFIFFYKKMLILFFEGKYKIKILSVLVIINI